MVISSYLIDGKCTFLVSLSIGIRCIGIRCPYAPSSHQNHNYVQHQALKKNAGSLLWPSWFTYLVHEVLVFQLYQMNRQWKISPLISTIITLLNLTLENLCVQVYWIMQPKIIFMFFHRSDLNCNCGRKQILSAYYLPLVLGDNKHLLTIWHILKSLMLSLYWHLKAKIRLSQKWYGSSCAKLATPNPLHIPVYSICKGNTLRIAQGSAKVHGKHQLSKKLLNFKTSHEEKWFMRLSRKFLYFYTVFLYFLCPKGCYHIPNKPNDWKKCISLINNWILRRLDRRM